MAESTRREMALVIASPLDESPPGSAPGRCMRCEQHVALGPEALQRMRDKPGTLHLTICKPCLLDLTREATHDSLTNQAWASKAGEAS